MKYVYVFDMDNDRVKIGITNDIRQRISSIEHASGFSVLHHYETTPVTEDQARKLERDLHQHFASYRARGEYFKITFEEACAELDRRKPTEEEVDSEVNLLTSQGQITNLVRLFAKTFCTTDRNERGIGGGGFFKDFFWDELITWFNANSNAFACCKEYFECHKCYNCRCFRIAFHDRATDKKIFDTHGDDLLKEVLGSSDFYSDRLSFYGNGVLVKNECFYAGVYWKSGSPQELALRQRVQRVRNAFTGLDRQAQDSIIGGFLTDCIGAHSEIFSKDGADLGYFACDVAKPYIERRLSEFCGEPFRVHIEWEHDPLFTFLEKKADFSCRNLCPTPATEEFSLIRSPTTSTTKWSVCTTARSLRYFSATAIWRFSGAITACASGTLGGETVAYKKDCIKVLKHAQAALELVPYSDAALNILADIKKQAKRTAFNFSERYTSDKYGFSSEMRFYAAALLISSEEQYNVNAAEYAKHAVEELEVALNLEVDWGVFDELIKKLEADAREAFERETDAWAYEVFPCEPDDYD